MLAFRPLNASREAVFLLPFWAVFANIDLGKKKIAIFLLSVWRFFCIG